jgi:hypothetical protein
MTDAAQPDTESLRLELKEAITAFNAQISLIAQSLGFIIAADVVLLGYGFSQRRSAIFLLTSLLPIAMLVVLIDLAASMMPMAYVATRLERKLLLQDAPLIGTYLKSCKGILRAAIGDVQHLDDLETHGFPPRIRFRFLLTDGRAILAFGAFIVQFCIFIVSVTVYHYPFM